MKKFNASIRRRMFWSNEVGGTRVCPECGERLEGEDHYYLMGIRYADDEADSSLVGCEGGYFCPSCPTVVLSSKKFEDMASLSADSSFSAFTVIGLVDLAAVPEEKSHLPFDEEDNPIPLVEFLDAPFTSGRRLEV